MRLLLLAAAMLTVVAPPAVAQYNPAGTITVAPFAPSPGDEVLVEVTGCSPAPGTVDVFIDGVIVGQAEVGADGTFSALFTVPIEAEGDVVVQVDCADETLSSMLDVQAPDVPFQDDDDEGTGGGALPRTGSDGAVPLAQTGLALVGLGCLFVLVAHRRNEEANRPEPRHG